MRAGSRKESSGKQVPWLTSVIEQMEWTKGVGECKPALAGMCVSHYCAIN